MHWSQLDNFKDYFRNLGPHPSVLNHSSLPASFWPKLGSLENPGRQQKLLKCARYVQTSWWLAAPHSIRAEHGPSSDSKCCRLRCGLRQMPLTVTVPSSFLGEARTLDSVWSLCITHASSHLFKPPGVDGNWICIRLNPPWPITLLASSLQFLPTWLPEHRCWVTLVWSMTAAAVPSSAGAGHFDQSF